MPSARRTSARRTSARRTSAIAVAAATLAVAGVVAPASASAFTTRPLPTIFRGERAPETPAVVRLAIPDGRCTATQINESWLLTAAHCIPSDANKPATRMFQSNSVTDPGPAYQIAEYFRAPVGDIALMRLAQPVPNTEYVTLNLQAEIASSGTATATGFGDRSFTTVADGLYRASVNLAGAGTDQSGAPAQAVVGITGAVSFGDSGGPLVVDGKQIGVVSIGNSFSATANYALLSQSAAWITATAGAPGTPTALIPAAPTTAPGTTTPPAPAPQPGLFSS